MKQSIESIWKEGFLNQDAMIAPKLNDLYNRKSKHIIDKMMIRLKWNYYFIYGFAVGLFFFSFLEGFPNSWTAIAIMFALLGVHGYRKMDDVKEFDKTISSYEYMKKFKDWRNQIIQVYTKIYRIFYPLVIIFFYDALLSSIAGQKLIAILLKENPDIPMFLGGPTYMFIFVIIIAILSIFLAKPLYMLDLKIVYGDLFQRMDEILSDMNELQKDR